MVLGGLGVFWFSVFWLRFRLRVRGLGCFIFVLSLVGVIMLWLLLWIEVVCEVF